MGQLTPQVPRVFLETPRVLRVENQTPPTIRVEPITLQIHVSFNKRYHTNNTDATVSLTGRNTDVAPPLHRYPTQSKILEADNHIATVKPDSIFYTRKLLTNVVIHTETGFSQEYRHLVKGDEKLFWHKSLSNKLGRIAQCVGNIVPGSNTIFSIPK